MYELKKKKGGASTVLLYFVCNLKRKKERKTVTNTRE